MSLDSRLLSVSEFSLIQSLAEKRKREMAPVSRTSDDGTASEDYGGKISGMQLFLSRFLLLLLLLLWWWCRGGGGNCGGGGC